MSNKTDNTNNDVQTAENKVVDKYSKLLSEGKMTISVVRARLLDEGIDDSTAKNIVEKVQERSKEQVKESQKSKNTNKEILSQDRPSSSFKELFENKAVRPNIVYSDTETTGGTDQRFPKSLFQILTASHIYRNETNDTELERLNVKLKLKKDKPVMASALVVNNTNPFTKKYDQEAISEYDYVQRLKSANERHKVSGKDGKPVMPKMSAYNIRFDREFISCAIARCGDKFGNILNKSCQDPLPAIRRMAKSKDFELDVENNKLGTVAQYFGFDLGAKAHTSEGDTEALIAITHGAFKMQSGGKSLKDYEPLTHTELKVGETYALGTNSVSSGYKERAIYVLANDLDNRKIIGVDSSALAEFQKTRDGSSNNIKKKLAIVREFNYDTIDSFLDANDPKNQANITSVMNEYKEDSAWYEGQKTEKEKQIKERLANSRGEEFSQAVYDAESLRLLADKLNSKHVTLAEAREILRRRKDFTEADVSAIITKATELNQSLGRGHFGDRTYHNDQLHKAITDDFRDLNIKFAHRGQSDLSEGELGAVTLLANLRARFPEKYNAADYPFIAQHFCKLNQDELMVDISDASSVVVTLPSELPELIIKEKKVKKTKAEKELEKESKKKNKTKKEDLVEEEKTPLEAVAEENSKEEERIEKINSLGVGDQISLIDQLPDMDSGASTQEIITEIKTVLKTPKKRGRKPKEKLSLIEGEGKSLQMKPKRVRKERCRICNLPLIEGEIGHVCRDNIKKAKSRVS